MDWSKASEVVFIAVNLASKYPDKIPMTDVYGIINAVESKNEVQFIEHLYWILRAIHANNLLSDPQALKMFDLVEEMSEEHGLGEG